MSSQVYADQYEWLVAQPNWRTIVNSSGFKGIKKFWTVQDCIGIIKSTLPNHKLPFDEEGKFHALNIKLHKSLKKTIHEKAMNYNQHHMDIVSNDKYTLLRKPACWKIEDSYEDYHREKFYSLVRFICYCFENKMPLNDKYTHQQIWKENFPEMTAQLFAPVELPLWIDFLFNNHLCIELEKLELELDNKLLNYKVKLPTMPTHICQEYFEMSSRLGVEKKCICCLDSDNMLLTTCGHVVCHGCFLHLRKQPEYKCPECRTIFHNE
jgi:hypothetical protein